MNEIIQKHAERVATQAVAEKYANGGAEVYLSLKGPEQFAEDVRTLTEQILALATSYGTKQADAEPVKARKSRKEKANAPKGGSVDSEILASFVKGGKYTLQQIADEFKVSKGVAERALNALEGVKSEPGTPEAGKRGKPAKVYFLP